MHVREEENGFQLVDTWSFTNSVIKIYLKKRPSNYECIQANTYKVYNKREREHIAADMLEIKVESCSNVRDLLVNTDLSRCDYSFNQSLSYTNIVLLNADTSI